MEKVEGVAGFDELASTVEVDGRVYNVDDLLDIDQNALSDEFASQASRYGYFAVLAAIAEVKMREAKHTVEMTYAEVDLAVRQELLKRDGKTTEASVRAEVLLDEQYIADVEAELKAQRDYNVLRALVNALEQRANMLVSLGAHMRHEYEMTDMNTRDPAVDRAKELRKRKR